MNSTRRGLLAASTGMALAPVLHRLAHAQEAPATRPIPSSAERLPVVGIGTAVIFDYENDATKQAARTEVIRTLVAGGGKLIDTAAGYGAAEERVGEIVQATGLRDKLFLATKFSFDLPRAEAEASLRDSLRRLRTDHVDLMQAWNVTDESYALALPREWKRAKLCRYVGITTSQARAYGAMGKVVAREKPDFMQVNYSLGNREAEKALLPAAADAGAAVLVNLPFGRNSLFRKAGTRPLPDFAAEFGARTWAQFFLKFILGHPAVTAVIPGTDKPEYMLDNLQAGRPPFPDAHTPADGAVLGRAELSHTVAHAEEYFAARFRPGRYDRGNSFECDTMTIPPNLRNHFYTGARIASGILLVVGIVLFWAAVSFEGYLLALITVALAGCSFTGAQELMRSEFLKPKAEEQPGLAPLAPEDAGSTPGSA